MRSDKSRTSNEVGVAIEEIIKEFETNFKSRGIIKLLISGQIILRNFI